MSREQAQPSLSSALQVILWQDIVVVIDDGRTQPREYSVLGELVASQAKKYAGGIGCLAVIPNNAVPPTDDARSALNSALQAARESLRCMCWLIEGTGFQGAMVKAVLTGVRLITRPSYATHVSTNMEEAIRWMLLQLPQVNGRTSDPRRASQEIARQRIA
jgi:hypothetical protein